MKRPLRFGIKTAPQSTTYADILRVWQEADTIPVIEHAWLFDHFAPINQKLDDPCLEGWTTLAALAAATQRLRLGLMVTGNTYRHPAVLTKIALTTDVISNGRLDFGIGAGWNEYEHASMGLDLYAPGERIRRLDEACAIYKSLATQHLTTFEGRYYQLHEARSEPKGVQRPYPPITIGGSGEKLTLRVVAKHADIWNFVGGGVALFQHKDSVLRDHCTAIGRDEATIERSVQVPVKYDDFAETIATAQGYISAGVTHVILNLTYPYPDAIVTRIAEEIIPQLHQH